MTEHDRCVRYGEEFWLFWARVAKLDFSRISYRAETLSKVVGILLIFVGFQANFKLLAYCGLGILFAALVVRWRPIGGLVGLAVAGKLRAKKTSRRMP